jgi:flagellar biosynthesis protein FlhG
MTDHDWRLRRLLMRTRQPRGAANDSPRIVVLTGGRVGVGTTTLAVGLATSLAEHGQRVVLVDADLARADVAAYCGVASSAGLGDVLAGERDIHEVLQLGPGGVQIVPGTTSAAVRTSCDERAVQRLVRQIRGLGPYAEAVILDTAALPGPLLKHLWEAADDVLLVTTPDAVAVMDCYALVRTLGLTSADAPRVRLLLNRTSNVAEVADVHRRIDQSCQRFLKLSLALAGAAPNWRSTTGKEPGPKLAGDKQAFLAAIDQLAVELTTTGPTQTNYRRAA